MIHEGKIVSKDNDVYGDEENIVSTIEQSAQTNSIDISDHVIRLVDNKSGLNTRFIQEIKLKM